MNLPERGKNNGIRNISEVVVIGGIHGNERTGIHVVQRINSDIDKYKSGSVSKIKTCLGNSPAIKKNVRYIDQDLNRSFQYDYNHPVSEQELIKLLESDSAYEVKRAMEIRGELKALKTPAEFVIDIHSTTSKMGNCLIVPDDDLWTDVLCEALRSEIPDCFIIYDTVSRAEDLTTSSLSVNQITLEMGPFQQGVAHYHGVKSAADIVKKIIKNIADLNGKNPLKLDPPRLKKYKRLFFKIDYPRDKNGIPTAMIHPDFLGRDFVPLEIGRPVFSSFSGRAIHFGDEGYFPPSLVDDVSKGHKIAPFFIGESAYVEKGMAFLTGEQVN